MFSIRILRVVILALLLPAVVRADAPPPAPTPTPVVTPAGNLLGVEVMSSTVMQEGQSSFSGLGLRVRFQSPSLPKQMELMPTLEWWRNSNTIHSPYEIATTRKDIALGLDARWDFSAGTFKPYLGAGYAVHFLSAEVNAPTFGLNDASDSVTKGGLALLGGVSMALGGKFETFTDLKYHHVTDYRQLKFNWGLSYNF